MVTAYLDESGHEGKNWMFVAGFLGTCKQWNDFVPKWREGRGNKKSLHMKDLRFKKDRDRRLLANLGPTPYQSLLRPVFGTVKYDDYAELTVGTKDEKPYKGYVLCLMGLAFGALRGMAEDSEMKSERLEIVLEEQETYAYFANMAMEFVAGIDEPWNRMEDGSPRLAKWSFVPKGTTMLTEPADYLAFALHELWVNGAGTLKSQWCSPILQRGDRQAWGKVLQRNDVRRLITEIQRADMMRFIERKILEWERLWMNRRNLT